MPNHKNDDQASCNVSGFNRVASQIRGLHQWARDRWKYLQDTNYLLSSLKVKKHFNNPKNTNHNEDRLTNNPKKEHAKTQTLNGPSLWNSINQNQPDYSLNPKNVD